MLGLSLAAVTLWRAPTLMEFMLCLPHPLVEIWVIWFLALPWQIGYLANRNKKKALNASGELVGFREIAAVGCIAGFVLLTFVTAFSIYLIMKFKELI